MSKKGKKKGRYVGNGTFGVGGNKSDLIDELMSDKGPIDIGPFESPDDKLKKRKPTY